MSLDISHYGRVIWIVASHTKPFVSQPELPFSPSHSSSSNHALSPSQLEIPEQPFCSGQMHGFVCQVQNLQFISPAYFHKRHLKTFSMKTRGFSQPLHLELIQTVTTGCDKYWCFWCNASWQHRRERKQQLPQARNQSQNPKQMLRFPKYERFHMVITNILVMVDQVCQIFYPGWIFNKTVGRITHTRVKDREIFALFIRLLITGILQMYHLPVAVLKGKISS